MQKKWNRRDAKVLRDIPKIGNVGNSMMARANMDLNRYKRLRNEPTQIMDKE